MSYAVKRQERAKAKRRAWLKRNGFTLDGATHIIFGNTYPIKENLKLHDFKFSKELLWHGPDPICVPRDCYVERIQWTDVYVWDENQMRMEFTEEGQKFLAEIFSKNAEGVYLGEVGERLRSIPAVFEREVTFEGFYGLTHVYTFKTTEGAQLTWFTSCEKDLEEGQEYLITGTVKKHEVYRNVKTTYLNRCIIK